MGRTVRCGLIQAKCDLAADKHPLARIKQAMLRKHARLIAAAARRRG